MVKTADGYKAIARIRAGDRVFAKDEASGKTGYKPVTAQYGNPYRETVYIEVSDGIGNSQTLISNRIHPFYSDGKWIKAEDLKAGSRLLSESGQTQTVRIVADKPIRKSFCLTGRKCFITVLPAGKDVLKKQCRFIQKGKLKNDG